MHSLKINVEDNVYSHLKFFLDGLNNKGIEVVEDKIVGKNFIEQISNIVFTCDFDIDTQIKAIELKDKYNLQYYDALIISTALENNCNIIFSEDMQHNQVIENRLTIINPFIKEDNAK
jgi:predicted nucleic acid-binding protein